VAVESAVTLPVFLLMLFGLFDLGIAVLRQNSLSECARRTARIAIVHGERAEESSRLGPQVWSGDGADSHVLTDAVRPLLVGMSPADVQFTVTWPDGDHRVGHRVRVELSSEYETSIPLPGGLRHWQLRAASTMQIVH
jgi:hypothetical protein